MRRRKIIQIIINMPIFFSQSIYALLKTLFLESKLISAKKSMIRIYLRNSFIIKICNFIAMRSYLVFNIFYCRQASYQILFFISPLTLSQIVLYFSNKSIIFNQKIHPFSFSIIPFNISTSFRKHYI